jgi:phosphoribosylglycinamide formyltransferase-1
LALNLLADLSAAQSDDAAIARSRSRAEAAGYTFVHVTTHDERLMSWVDWQFAPSWWSAEVRAGKAWYALAADGTIAGFAAYDVKGVPYPWQRAYRKRPEVGVFGPHGVAKEHRKTEVGEALLLLALGSLRTGGYARALLPAVSGDRLIAMYRERTGAEPAEDVTYETSRRFRTTILASGSGTTAQSVIDLTAGGRLPLTITGVVANVADAGVLARAREANIDARTVVWNREKDSRHLYDSRVIATVAEQQPDLVLLLGWMHLLPPTFIRRFPDILNVHPSFLPLDPGANTVVMPDGTTLPVLRGARAIRDAVAAGGAWSGASVHRVTPEMDRGAIAVRIPVRLDAPHDEPMLREALRPLEHAAVASAIQRWMYEQIS